MNCDECREQILEADPDLLTGLGDEPVARHVRSCEECRALATAMFGQLQAARSMYARIEPVSQPPRHVVRPIARRAVWAVASLAAAAVVLAIVGRRDVGSAPPSVTAEQPNTSSTSLSVVVPDGRNAIVFATRNPLVSVVWIY